MLLAEKVVGPGLHRLRLYVETLLLKIGQEIFRHLVNLIRTYNHLVEVLDVRLRRVIFGCPAQLREKEHRSSANYYLEQIEQPFSEKTFLNLISKLEHVITHVS